MAIHNQKTISTTFPQLSMLFKVLNPLYTFLIHGPVSMGCSDNPIGQQRAIFILVGEVMLPRD